MPLDHYVTLGHSGLRVSPLCLGTMTFGKEWGWGSEPEEAKRILDAYLDRGGNFLDTANGYTKGHCYPRALVGERLTRALGPGVELGHSIVLAPPAPADVAT